MKLIVGMTGATGAPLGVALLQALREMPNVETHLVMSKWAKTTIELETPYSARDVAALADFSHNPADRTNITVLAEGVKTLALMLYQLAWQK